RENGLLHHHRQIAFRSCKCATVRYVGRFRPPSSRPVIQTDPLPTAGDPKAGVRSPVLWGATEDDRTDRRRVWWTSKTRSRWSLLAARFAAFTVDGGLLSPPQGRNRLHDPLKSRARPPVCVRG